LSSPDRQHRV